MTSSLLHYAAAMDAYPPRSLANSLSLAARLPDIPRWVEARALLLSHSGEIFGLEDETEPSFVLRDPDAESIFVIGAPDPTVVRGALRLVTQLATPSAVPALIRLFRSSDPCVRQDVITALGAVDSLGALQAIERGVDDANRDVRIVALRMVAARKYQGALPRLSAAIRRKELRDADLGEKVALFEAFGTICGVGGVPELDTLLNARGLLGPRESAEMRACAARALGLVNASDADVALQRASETKDAVVRSAVARALRKGT